MQTRMIFVALFLFFAGEWIFIACKKDKSGSSDTFTNERTIQVQNADAQDALADKTEEDIDNQLEELQNDNYSFTSTKSDVTTLTDTVIISVNHPDTTTFPKVITLTYYNYKDSCATENIWKNGQITVNINCPDTKHPRMISRAFAFHKFTITTDSTIVLLSGTRLVNRQKDAVAMENLNWARISVTDNISAALSYSIIDFGQTDTLSFTRKVNKIRTAITHYKNINFKNGDPVYNIKNLRFKHYPSFDSLKYTGSVSGANEKGEPYTKTVTSPLIITGFKGSLIVTSGTISYVVGNGVSDEFSFREDPAHKHFTLVTVQDTSTGDTKSFDRRFGRTFKKWW